jgi:hypothetical protein
MKAKGQEQEVFVIWREMKRKGDLQVVLLSSAMERKKEKKKGNF